MFHNREPITRVAAALGHSTPAITLLVYAHIIPTEDSGAAQRLDQLIGFEIPSGSKTVATSDEDPNDCKEVIERLVAKGGIEPPTQGFSGRSRRKRKIG